MLVQSLIAAASAVTAQTTALLVPVSQHPALADATIHLDFMQCRAMRVAVDQQFRVIMFAQ